LIILVEKHQNWGSSRFPRPKKSPPRKVTEGYGRLWKDLFGVPAPRPHLSVPPINIQCTSRSRHWSSRNDSVKGIVAVARDEKHISALPEGKTKPSDATLADFRVLRRCVNKAALSGRLSAYYLDTTWETLLPTFRTPAEPNVYQRLPNGNAILDGYPVIWTDVLHPYSTDADPDVPIAVFGALSFWWFGEHGQPRMDTSDHVWFANDQLAVRFIEEIDFDYAAPDATAALLTAEE
jgi:hypothetical protein